mmetsp:Transcript_28562/g.61215  ORF Transcript_28562/g.61215 Transcript_28562/m.61215 type:complete len:480 (+) Transcript_28562:50-1489(+)
MKDLYLKTVTMSVLSLVLGSAHGATAEDNRMLWAVTDDDQDAVSLKLLESYWIDAADIISDLGSYDKLWIRPHSCVWSECAIDDVDDGYMGDNRDGDEQWYQYRTQGFCANAAFSLYGQKKEEETFMSFRGCTKRHFINSFFTYGGADNLLKAVGETPVTFSYDNDDEGNGDDDTYGKSANAACNEIDYEPSDDYFVNKDDEDDQGDDERSGSGSNDYDGYSGTLGCGVDGRYIIGAFQSESCDGNYFAGIADSFEEYNDQHNSIGCHNIYQKGDEVSAETVTALLSNSWSCDLRLYPKGCPDPYGEKKNYDFAIRTISNGGNPQLAYKNMMLRSPLHVASWVMLVLTIMIVVLTYLVKHESRAIRSKGGKNFMGYLRCLQEDIILGFHSLVNGGKKTRSKRSGTKNSSTRRKKKNKSSKKRGDNNGESDEPTGAYVPAEDIEQNKFGKNGVALVRSGTEGQNNNDPGGLDEVRSQSWT